MDIINYFKNNLKESEMYEKELNEFYMKNVKDIKKVKTVKFDQKGIKFQLSGIDKVIVLKNKKVLKIEEKIRFKTYNVLDLFLEDTANTTINSPGWITDNKKVTDILVYYIVPLNMIYVMNFKKLQSIYKIKRQEWLSMYCWTYSKNKNYETKGLCVPMEELEQYIKIKKYKI